MGSIYPRARFTSRRRGEVDLRSKSGEGVPFLGETLTPHPRLRRDLSQRERWTADTAALQPEAVIL